MEHKDFNGDESQFIGLQGRAQHIITHALAHYIESGEYDKHECEGFLGPPPKREEVEVILHSVNNADVVGLHGLTVDKLKAIAHAVAAEYSGDVLGKVESSSTKRLSESVSESEATPRNVVAEIDMSSDTGKTREERVKNAEETFSRLGIKVKSSQIETFAEAISKRMKSDIAVAASGDTKLAEELATLSKKVNRVIDDAYVDEKVKEFREDMYEVLYRQQGINSL